jgi:tRNA U55 pseudouridine synthase TruB
MTVKDKIFENISKLTSVNEIDQIHDQLNAHITELNRDQAGKFKLNERVAFTERGDAYEGIVESIGRTGKIKINLIKHWKYSQYTMGAARLAEKLGK